MRKVVGLVVFAAIACVPFVVAAQIPAGITTADAMCVANRDYTRPCGTPPDHTHPLIGGQACPCSEIVNEFTISGVCLAALNCKGGSAPSVTGSLLDLLPSIPSSIAGIPTNLLTTVGSTLFQSLMSAGGGGSGGGGAGGASANTASLDTGMFSSSVAPLPNSFYNVQTASLNSPTSFGFGTPKYISAFKSEEGIPLCSTIGTCTI